MSMLRRLAMVTVCVSAVVVAGSAWAAMTPKEGTAVVDAQFELGVDYAQGQGVCPEMRPRPQNGFAKLSKGTHGL